MSKAFGIHLPSSVNLPFDTISLYAKKCGELGIDSIWVADHILGSAGRGPYEPLILLSALAAVTERVKLGTSVLLAALRNPVLLADITGTIQKISQNRFIFGVGVGWDKHEFENLGVSYEERGSVTNELLSVVTSLWRGRPQTRKGRYFTLKRASIAAPPSNIPPVWIGGNSLAAIKRASEYDAWFPTDPTTEEIAKGVKELRRVSKRRPLTAAHIYLVVEENSGKALRNAGFLSEMTGEPLKKVRQWAIVGDPDEARRRINEYRSAGVEYFVFSLPQKGNYLERIGQVTKLMSE